MIQDCKSPAMTVLFPSSTRSVSLDNEESNTFPSISLPWKQNICQIKNIAIKKHLLHELSFRFILGCLNPPNVLKFDIVQFRELDWLNWGAVPLLGAVTADVLHRPILSKEDRGDLLKEKITKTPDNRNEPQTPKRAPARTHARTHVRAECLPSAADDSN